MRSVVPRRVPGQRVREYLRLQAARGRGAAGEDELSRPRRTRAGFAGMNRVAHAALVEWLAWNQTFQGEVKEWGGGGASEKRLRGDV